VLTRIPNSDALAKQLAASQAQPRLWDAFLAALASSRVMTLLRRPPGNGDAAPWRNLVQWRQKDGGRDVALIFTGPDQFPHALPPPSVLVRVQMRELLSIADHPPLMINPLSTSPWLLTQEQCDAMRAMLAEQGLGTEQPRPDAPWAFRLPRDEAYPIAEALARWFIQYGRVNIAYLYTVERGLGTQGEVLVLAVDEKADSELARQLTVVARSAGAAESFLVRFLPDEPTHHAAVSGMGLEPFYRRPR
jgi:hypothetical protein